MENYYRWHLQIDDPNDLPPAVHFVDDDKEDVHYIDSLPVVAYLGDAEYSDGSIEPMYRCGTYTYDEIGSWFIPYASDPVKADKVIAWKYIEPIPLSKKDSSFLADIKRAYEKFSNGSDLHDEIGYILREYAQQ